jgi:hypothetical protein
MRIYHFNVAGKPGQLGFTAEVRARSRIAAVNYLNGWIKRHSDDEFRPVTPPGEEKSADRSAIIYFEVWLNDIQISDDDIDEERAAA